MQHRFFKLLLEDDDVQFTDLLLHTEVRWLSREYTVESLNLNNENFTATSYLEIIDKLVEEFSSRFEDFAALEPVLRFFINPFNVTEDDVLEIVSVYFRAS
ncbi:uncharacterized protein TNCT_491371 [Trichonephila clavata]|uniref:Uncharacterized protein n=1 Tax=Trichonephila clavata TaxID=2740835 RepID=A0A8X6LUX8_TRICU|nr:uncharacterized protein TNCT_491371 [Trichonephila clavata]